MKAVYYLFSFFKFCKMLILREVVGLHFYIDIKDFRVLSNLFECKKNVNQFGRDG